MDRWIGIERADALEQLGFAGARGQVIEPLVRAMVLTSTKAVPNSTSDLFSDYDVILALREIQPFYENRNWLEAFGRVLVLYRDPLETEYGYPKAGYVIQFEDGLKIDFTLWSTEILQKVVAEQRIGSLEKLAASGHRLHQDSAHAHRLGALAGKEEGEL